MLSDVWLCDVFKSKKFYCYLLKILLLSNWSSSPKLSNPQSKFSSSSFSHNDDVNYLSLFELVLSSFLISDFLNFYDDIWLFSLFFIFFDLYSYWKVWLVNYFVGINGKLNFYYYWLISYSYWYWLNYYLDRVLSSEIYLMSIWSLLISKLLSIWLVRLIYFLNIIFIC